MALKNIGLRLRQIRKRKKMTQTEFADLLNTSQRNISKYENERLEIPNKIKIDLIKFGINMNWLLTGEGEMYSKTKGNQDGFPTLLEEKQESKLTDYLFPEDERMETDLGGMEKRVDLIRSAAKIDKRVTLNAMISLREYLDKQIRILSE